MTYDEAVKNGLEPYIVKPGEKITTLSSLTKDNVDNIDAVLEKLTGSFITNDISTYGMVDGEVTLLDYNNSYSLASNEMYCDECNGIIKYNDNFSCLKCNQCGKNFRYERK